MTTFPRVKLLSDRAAVTDETTVTPEPTSADFSISDGSVTFTPGYLLGAISQPAVSSGASESRLVYSTQDHTTPSYVRSANRLMPLADLTCISPWNSNLGVRKAGTLITPRHVACAMHYKIPVGATIRFVALDNSVVDRMIAAVTDIYDDLSIATLDSDVPASITPAKVMPSNWSGYVSSAGWQYSVAWTTDAEEKMLPRRISGITPATITLNQTSFSNLLPYDEGSVGGDSGNPVFVIIDSECVLLACAHRAVVGTSYIDGTSIHSNTLAIEALVAATGHSLDYLDLSGYSTQ